MSLLVYSDQIELLYFKLKTETPYLLHLKEKRMKQAISNTVSYFLQKEFGIENETVINDLVHHILTSDT